MISMKVTVKGDFKKTDKFLKKKLNIGYWELLEHYGRKGVEALKNATPVDSGATRAAWYYLVEATPGGARLTWCNDNKSKYVNVAILLDQGHATRNGGYVRGLHYIDPAVRPVMQEIADTLMREVRGL